MARRHAIETQTQRASQASLDAQPRGLATLDTLWIP